MWSPDGTRLACEGQGETDPSLTGVYTLRASDGSDLQRVTSDLTGDDCPSDYSPNGKRLVITRANDTTYALYTVKLDGTPAPVQGSPVVDMVSVRKIDDRTREFKNMKDGKTVGESRATVSADGKTATVTGSGVNPKGVKVTFTAVYDKQ